MGVFDKLTNLFKQSRGEIGVSAGTGQLRDEYNTPFAAAFSDYEPAKFNLDLYDVIREAIPILDEAVSKLKGLLGTFEIQSENGAVKKTLDEFCQTVLVNYHGYGINEFVNQMADSAIVKGFGVGELVPNLAVNDIYRLKTAKSNYFRFVKHGDDLVLAQRIPGVLVDNVIENMENIYYLAFDKRDGYPQGYSLFWSLPFMAEIFVRISSSINNTIWRVGDPTFAIIVEGGEKSSTKECDQAASKIKDAVIEAMKSRKSGRLRDVYGGISNATVKISTLGTDKDLVNLEIPMRTILEQIIAKTGLPPFMFGISWSTTERMSTHQNDMVVSNIETQREKINPILQDIFDKKLILSGVNKFDYDIVWNPVNLMDEKEQAQARYMDAQAKAKDYERIAQMYLDGIFNEDELRNELLECRLISKRAAMQPIDKLVGQMTRQVKLNRSQKQMENIFREM